MGFEFKKMTQKEAEEIAFNWHYGREYAFYNMEADKEDLAEFLDAKEREGIVFAAYAKEVLVGFVTIASQDEETIEIGLGLRPDLTGQGLGRPFMEAGLAFAKKHFSFLRVTLAVAAFNGRAIRLYEKIGFKQTGIFKQETNGGEYDFVKMAFPLLPQDVEEIVRMLAGETRAVLKDNFVGFYIHGSLAMGGFHPGRSDIDVLIITELPLGEAIKQRLRDLLLSHSGKPFPIEVSVMDRKQLTDWQHPSPFDFHYSEVWRHRMDQPAVDPDLAAHLTVLGHRGFCAVGEPVADVIPAVPWPDYIEAILSDFSDCRKASADNPVYCVLNAIRVLAAVKERKISSKAEAGDWGRRNLPENWHELTSRAAGSYATGEKEILDVTEVDGFLTYIENEIKQEMGKRHAEENDRPGLL